MRSFDKVIGFSFSELIVLAKLICNTKMIYKQIFVCNCGIAVIGGALVATSLAA